MERGDLYRTVPQQGGDPRRSRIYCVVSRASLLNSAYSTVICAPLYTVRSGLASEVAVGADEGLGHDSVIRCDELTSIHRALLRNWIGRLRTERMDELQRALAAALDIELA